MNRYGWGTADDELGAKFAPKGATIRLRHNGDQVSSKH
jgi:hypothetical protein